MLIKVTDIILLSFSLYKEHFKLFAKYLAILFVPTAFWQLSGGIVRPLFANLRDIQGISMMVGVGYLVLVVLAMLFAFWITISIIRTCADIYLKMQRKNIHDELADTRPFVWPALLASFASGLMFLVWYVPLLVKAKFNATAMLALLTIPKYAFTSLLLLIPALYFGVLFVFSAYNVVIHKQHSVMKALKTAYDMVQRRWWAVTWRLAIPWFVFWLLAQIPEKLTGITTIFVTRFLEPNSWEFILAANLVSAVFIATGLLFLPLVLFAKTILYAELRKVPVKK